MPTRFRSGDTAFILVSNLYIHEVKVLRVEHGFALIQIKGEKGRINLRESRLFTTKEKVIASVKRGF